MKNAVSELLSQGLHGNGTALSSLHFNDDVIAVLFP
jgi:hypothetical protein